MNAINPIIAELLKKRGISEEIDMFEFLSDKPQLTYNPFLLHNLEAGVDFILSSIKEHKRICIYGDYDADGITSICLLMQVLSHLTDNTTYYIPSRFDEGYGLNREALDTIKAEGADLVITVDCGSVSYDEVAYAKQIGLDIIVTDHHSITNQASDCILINPKQPDCTYPFKDLAGCGVAFKVAQGLQKKGNLPQSVLTEVLDLAALGTIGDIVPLIDENRTIAKYGMKLINRQQRKGLSALIEAISLSPGKINSDHVSYAIIPHINAAGRMKDAHIAVELLLSEDEKQIEAAVTELIESNQERKFVQEETYNKCMEIVEDQCKGDSFLVIDSPDAHEGIAGIVAGKVKDYYYRPTVIVTPVSVGTETGEFLKGTSRSIPTVNLYEVLKLQERLFTKFGGHAGACGFLMKKENLETFKTGVNKTLNAQFKDNINLFNKDIRIDMELSGKDATEALAAELELLSPFGCQNEKAVFAIQADYISEIKYMGDLQQHVRFMAICPGATRLQCVLFNRAKEFDEFFTAEGVNLIGSLDCQEWRGVKRIQLIVDEIEKII